MTWLFFSEHGALIGRVNQTDPAREAPKAVFWRGRFFVWERSTPANTEHYKEVAAYDLPIEDMQPVPRDRT